MTQSKRIAFAVAVSWFSKGLSITANFFLIPILFRHMGKEELGLWYLLGSSQAFLGLLGFGVAPILTRHIAFGNKTCNVNPDAALTAAEAQSLGNLLVTGRRVLQCMAVATFLIAWVSGYFLIRTVPVHSVSWTKLLCAWTLMCAGYGIGVWLSYLDCWIAGVGFVGWDTLISTGFAFATTVSYIVAVLLGGGLLSLASISVAAALLQRFALMAFLRRRQASVFSIRGRWDSLLANKLVRPSLYLWVTSLGGFLLYKTDQYFIAFFRGTAEVALYQSTYNTIFMMSMIALTYTGASTVFVSQFWAEGSLAAIHRIFVRSCRLGLFIMATGAIFILLAGKEFFNLWLKGAFIGYPVIILLLITLALDLQHGLLTGISRATDDERYAIPAVVAGVLNLGLTWVLIQRLGIVGVVLGTLVAQVLTNNWYGVYRPLVRLQFSFLQYLKQVVLPVVSYAALACIFGMLLKNLGTAVWGYSRWAICIAVFTGCVISACIGLIVLFKKEFTASKAAVSEAFKAYATKLART
jgi:O-antigen/teichoic acid export membrane protein